MSDILPYSPVESIKREAKKIERRQLAAALSKSLGRTRFNVTTGKKQSYKIIIANMLLEAISTGIVTFIDGRALMIDDIKDWNELVKFAFQHMDGPATNDSLNLIAQQNIYKVYAGFDPDQV